MLLNWLLLSLFSNLRGANNNDLRGVLLCLLSAPSDAEADRHAYNDEDETGASDREADYDSLAKAG